jgi:hypothetical protein
MRRTLTARLPSPLTRRFAAAAAAVVLLLAVGCDGTPTDPYVRHAGPYILHSIDGQLLPVVLQQDAEGSLTVTTGSLTLRRDRSFSETWTGRFDTPEGPPQFGGFTAAGTYEIVGEEITFRLPAAPGRDEATIVGAIRGDTLMYAVGGRLIVYLD